VTFPDTAQRLQLQTVGSYGEVTDMAGDHLGRYLNDHLAGAASALQLMEQIERTHAGSPAGAAVSEIKREVEADRGQLQALIARLGIGESAPRKAAAWLSEHLAHLKLRVDDPADSGFRLFEAIETLSLGIEGKKSLWRTLAASTGEVPALRGVDYDALIARADEQRRTFEPHRLAAAKDAFTVHVAR
jgi:hypothetical protein